MSILFKRAIVKKTEARRLVTLILKNPILRLQFSEVFMQGLNLISFIFSRTGSGSIFELYYLDSQHS